MNKQSWVICLLFGLICHTRGQSDSLRSALNEIDRRQRELPDYDENEYGYALNRPDDVAFLKSYAPERGYDGIEFLNKPLNYLDDDAKYDRDNLNKRLSSAFRERVEEDHERQLEERAQNLISNMDRTGRYSDEDYEELLRELWDKYRKPLERKLYNQRMSKRMYYPRFGLDSVGLRKRSPYGEDEESYGNQEVVRDYDLDDEEGDDIDASANYLRKRYYGDGRMSRLHQLYGSMYPYAQMKRFPVAKRSSGDYLAESRELSQQKKESAPRKQTDPKVEKELSEIFGGKKNESTTKKPETTKPTVVKKSTPETKTSKKPANTDKKNKANTKEEFAPVALVGQKPLQLKKKSVDWSDYFGLDRRKKSEPNDVDKEWLIERYHKSIALSNKKGNAELPLSAFRNHDGLVKKESESRNDSGKSLPEDKKLDEIDSKLQVMEDTIVDDTLKYTGAHEGETDPKEIQEVKDKIIARLAAAYNLEKMRNALSEYRMAVAKERERLKNRIPEDEEYMFTEEKRTAIPRKQVVEEEVAEADNNIKCAEGSEDCHEQSYRTPSEIVETRLPTDECPAVERACNDVASIVGQYGHLFRGACTIHQMCLICSNNSWFTPTRQCNALYLAKAFDLCKDNASCQKEAQRSIRYLLDVNHSLHAQPTEVNDCEMSCPETDNPFDLNSR